LDRLLTTEEKSREPSGPEVVLDRVLEEVKKLSGTINALVDRGAQTGGVKSAGKAVINGESALIGEPKRGTRGTLPDLNTIVSRLRLSLPIMRAA
jgi:hypothetical protein